MLECTYIDKLESGLEDRTLMRVALVSSLIHGRLQRRWRQKLHSVRSKRR